MSQNAYTIGSWSFAVQSLLATSRRLCTGLLQSPLQASFGKCAENLESCPFTQSETRIPLHPLHPQASREHQCGRFSISSCTARASYERCMQVCRLFLPLPDPLLVPDDYATSVTAPVQRHREMFGAELVGVGNTDFTCFLSTSRSSNGARKANSVRYHFTLWQTNSLPPSEN